MYSAYVRTVNMVTPLGTTFSSLSHTSILSLSLSFPLSAFSVCLAIFLSIDLSFTLSLLSALSLITWWCSFRWQPRQLCWGGRVRRTWISGWFSAASPRLENAPAGGDTSSCFQVTLSSFPRCFCPNCIFSRMHSFRLYPLGDVSTQDESCIRYIYSIQRLSFTGHIIKCIFTGCLMCKVVSFSGWIWSGIFLFGIQISIQQSIDDVSV